MRLKILLSCWKKIIRVNEQVKSFSRQRNVTLPATPSDDKQKMYTDMEKMTGKAFDKEYISMMVKSS